MLNRGDIIENTLLMLGNTEDYNDNEDKEYTLANKQLDKVIREIMLNQNYLFNAVEVKLNRATDEKNHREEYKYHEPVNYIALVNRNHNFRKVGKFIYSKQEEVYMTYCKEVPFEEIPEQMENIIIYSLAVRMCQMFSQYTKYKSEYMALLAQSIEEMKTDEPIETRDVLSESMDGRRPWRTYIGTGPCGGCKF